MINPIHLSPGSDVFHFVSCAKHAKYIKGGREMGACTQPINIRTLLVRIFTTQLKAKNGPSATKWEFLYLHSSGEPFYLF